MALSFMTMDVIQQLNKEGWAVQPGDFGESILHTFCDRISNTISHHWRSHRCDLQWWEIVLEILSQHRSSTYFVDITLTNFPYAHFAVGQVYTIGDVTFEISMAIDPCNSLGSLPYPSLTI
jgi:hypothetical protein